MSALNTVKKGGFVIWREGTESYRQINDFSSFNLESFQLKLVFQANCQGEKVSLLKKVRQEIF